MCLKCVKQMLLFYVDRHIWNMLIETVNTMEKNIKTYLILYFCFYKGNVYLHSLDHHELLYQWLCLSCQVHGPLQHDEGMD